MTLLPTLSEAESQVYLASLELGSETILRIAKKAGIPRATTYLVVEELKAKGLVSQTKLGKKTLITAAEPEKLMILLSQEEAKVMQARLQIEAQLPQLKAIQNNREDKPLVSFYEGFEGMKTILEKSLKAKEILVVCSGYKEPMDPVMEKYMDEVYLPETNRLGIKTKEIVTRDPDLDKYLKMYESPDHVIKVSERDPAQDHLDKLIFDNTVALVAYDALDGTVIEHPHIARFERALFDEIWKSIN